MMINQQEIEAQAEKLKLETGKEIQAIYSEHGGVQYFPANTNLTEGFGMLYVTKESDKQ